MSFKDKVVLVTGASSGIGAATAILFTKEGANVSMVGRNEAKLKNVAAKCMKKPLVIIADVTKEEDMKRIVDETIKKFGKIDVLVNNAGMGAYGTILDGKILHAYDAVMNVNLRAVIHLTMLATPHLVKSKGNIVNISSIAAITTPMDNFIPYCISKAGLDHFTRGAALELSASGVRVNSVNPGPVETDFLENSNYEGTWDVMKEMTPLKRVSKPEEIADIILFLASEKAVGITGSVFVSDNGFLLKRTIINISSVGGMTTPTLPSLLSYSISKAALDQFTRGAALELAGSGVRVNSVNPGPVEGTSFLENSSCHLTSWEFMKKMTPMDRVSWPDEIAHMVMYLASDKATGITGSLFVCDNGYLLKGTRQCHQE